MAEKNEDEPTSMGTILNIPLETLKVAGKNFIKYVLKSKEPYFYPEEIIKEMLIEHDFSVSKNTKFIDYTNCYRYYNKDRYTFTINTDSSGKSKKIGIPYKELVNFIEKPEAKINVVGDIKEFQMSPEVENLTEASLKAYLEENKGTTPGPILRVSSFKKIKKKYVCMFSREV